MKATYVFVVLCILLSACSLFMKEENVNKGKLLAQVGDNKLHLKEIRDILKTTEDEDTAVVISNYVHNWVSRQLVLEKAEEQLPEEVTEIDVKVQDYRESLIIYRYEQELIRQKLDTVITDAEIEEYFEKYENNFVLEEEIIDVSYVKMLLNSPTKDSVTRWFNSSSLDDHLKLEEFCNQYAVNFNIKESNWVEKTKLINLFTTTDPDYVETLLSTKDKFSFESDPYYLQANIRNRRLKGSEAPLNYVRKQIKKILLNKRKLSLVDEIHQRILEDGQRQGKFKIYNK